MDKLLASFDKVDNVCNYRGENMKRCKTKIAASFGLGKDYYIDGQNTQNLRIKQDSEFAKF